MSIKNKTIAIVGGGPGGLTLARLLQNSGIEAQIFERDIHRNARPQGATLDLHQESGLKALEVAGLMDAFRTHYRPGADRMRVTNQRGEILLDEGVNAANELFRPEIDRGPLQHILLDSLLPDTVHWDHYFQSISPKNQGWEIHFKGRTSVFADLVIGADGANSKIRSYVTPIRPFYSGIIMIEGIIYDSATTSPKIHELLNDGKIFAFGDAQSIIVSSKGNGGLVFYTGHRADESWSRDCGIDFADKAQVLAWFHTEFAGWDRSWDALFEDASAAFLPRPQYCMPLDQRWDTQPNLTLIGDAAHLMPPYAGEGVNMAMLDALELYECLTCAHNYDQLSALTTYEKQMLARFAEIGQITLNQTASLHSPEALDTLLAMMAEHE